MHHHSVSGVIRCRQGPRRRTASSAVMCPQDKLCVVTGCVVQCVVTRQLSSRQDASSGTAWSHVTDSVTSRHVLSEQEMSSRTASSECEFLDCSASWLCFSSVHLVGTLVSKLPSIISSGHTVVLDFFDGFALPDGVQDL